MAEGFKGIKERDGIHLTFSDKILHLAFVIALGAAMGFFAEYLEYSYYHAPPGSFSRGDVAYGLANIGNRFSLWILTATLIAYFSRGPGAAGLHTLSYFVSMNTVYFYYKTAHYGYSIKGQLIFWSVVGALSVGAAVLLWYSRMGGWPGALIKGAPVGVIASEAALLVFKWIEEAGRVYGSGYAYFFQTEHMVEILFYLAAVTALPLLLAKGAKERLRTGLAALLMCPAFFLIFRALL